MYMNKVIMERRYYGTSEVYETKLFVFTPANVLMVRLLDLHTENRVGVRDVKVLTPKSMETFMEEVQEYFRKQTVTIFAPWDFETLCPQYYSALEEIKVEGNHATWKETVTEKDLEPYDDDLPF